MKLPGTGLDFSDITPAAPEGLGGLVRDHFANGRTFATVAWHGGLVSVSYCGSQHLGAPAMFNVGIESAWLKLFRACVGLGSKRYYIPWKNSKLYPFGMTGEGKILGVDFGQELLLLPDALVQRYRVLKNPRKLPVFIEMFHQEKICRVGRENRTWTDFKFDPRANAMIAACTDTNPDIYTGEFDSLSQQGLGLRVKDSPRATTWIGVGCSAPMKARVSHNGFKIYFTSAPVSGKDVTFFVVFADSEKQLKQRLAALSKSVGKECDQLLAGYENRLAQRPKIDVGDDVLNSAFGQYPEMARFMEIDDRPGAVRASMSGYFVWGWDGMTPLQPAPLANDAPFAARILRFMQESRNKVIGIPLAFTNTFQAKLKEPFPSQAQYIAGLYSYVAATGDIALAREMMPTCRMILDRCRERLVKNTGLVAGNALWPDFPEAMDENGDDVAAINNSLFYQGLRCMEYLAAAVGDEKLAIECRDWAKTLRDSFVKYLFDNQKGFFITSCSSKDLSPRKHYGCQTLFWTSPFGRELVSHAPGRIARFLHEELRSERCLLSLPQWDKAWMADGNQLGSSYPTSDYFYLNAHKLVGDDRALDAWLGDVEYFWRYHTAPEAFTPEAENEDEFGPDNHGGKQLQALTCWYACLYFGLAGLDIDHEGVTFTPWGDRELSIRDWKLRGTSIDLSIRGAGTHIGSLKVNGKSVPAGSRKVPWKDLRGKTTRIELVRSKIAPAHPVIVRADGLAVSAMKTSRGQLTATVTGKMSGEVVAQVKAGAKVLIDGKPQTLAREASTGTVSVPFAGNETIKLAITQ